MMLISFLLLATSAIAREITVVSDSWCPYNCEPGDEKEGFGIDLLRQIFAVENITVVYTLMPWQDAIDAVDRGEFHAVVGAYHSDAKQLVFPKTPFALSTNCFYITAENHWDYINNDSLKGVRLGTLDGYSYGADIDSYLRENERPGDKVFSGDMPLPKLKKSLLDGEVDVIIEDEMVFEFNLINAAEKKQFKSVSCRLAAKVYVAFSAHHTETDELLKIYEKGLLRLLSNGEYQKIMQRYTFAAD
ncbi:MAG: transporter substrate-binding domain-containing protein [Pseudomonadales bacterium]|nr:transporter substrate-binding domain-containing protein [Pseudomonadales bacterium]